MHDCSDFIKFNGPKYWKEPKTGMPKTRRSDKSKTSAFARLFFPKEADRIEKLHKKDVAAKKARMVEDMKATTEADVEETKEAEGATDAAEGLSTPEAAATPGWSWTSAPAQSTTETAKEDKGKGKEGGA